MKGTVYALLGKVSEQSGYLFIYDSKVIHNDSVAVSYPHLDVYKRQQYQQQEGDYQYNLCIQVVQMVKTLAVPMPRTQKVPQDVYKRQEQKVSKGDGHIPLRLPPTYQ